MTDEFLHVIWLINCAKLLDEMYVLLHIILTLHRDKQQMQRTLRRQDKKIKEYQTTMDDERRAAEQYKDQVGKYFTLNFTMESKSCIVQYGYIISLLL